MSEERSVLKVRMLQDEAAAAAAVPIVDAVAKIADADAAPVERPAVEQLVEPVPERVVDVAVEYVVVFVDAVARVPERAVDVVEPLVVVVVAVVAVVVEHGSVVAPADVAESAIVPADVAEPIEDANAASRLAEPVVLEDVEARPEFAMIELVVERQFAVSPEIADATEFEAVE